MTGRAAKGEPSGVISLLQLVDQNPNRTSGSECGLPAVLGDRGVHVERTATERGVGLDHLDIARVVGQGQFAALDARSLDVDHLESRLRDPSPNRLHPLWFLRMEWP